MKKSSKVIAVLVIIIICCMGALTLSVMKINALSEKNTWYNYQYIHAYNAMETVAEYCDSTADTGQMDDFIQSDNGQFFWSEFKKVDENQ